MHCIRYYVLLSTDLNFRLIFSSLRYTIVWSELCVRARTFACDWENVVYIFERASGLLEVGAYVGVEHDDFSSPSLWRFFIVTSHSTGRASSQRKCWTTSEKKRDDDGERESGSNSNMGKMRDGERKVRRQKENIDYLTFVASLYWLSNRHFSMSREIFAPWSTHKKLCVDISKAICHFFNSMKIIFSYFLFGLSVHTFKYSHTYVAKHSLY